MKLFEGLDSISEPFLRSTVAIGTFDGIHVGHQAIIHRAVEDARSRQCPAIVFTFDRHPAELLAPDRAPSYLTTPWQRQSLIAELNADALVIARFDETLARLTPDEFTQAILKQLLGAEAVVVGIDFAFGKGRAGDVDYLTAAQASFGFELQALDPVLVDGLPASSTRVREALRAGDIRQAERVLGHAYWLDGRIVEGQKLGRQLGYPTANLELKYRQTAPCDGIYAVRAWLDDGRLVNGACSIGNRPTVEGAGRSIETYLFDFNDDIYGAGMQLRFVERLRGEEKFDSLAALTEQMAADVLMAKQILG